MRARDFDRAPGLRVVVDTAERFEVRRVEALDADRQAVHARGAKAAELVRFERAGIRFQRDFGVRRERQRARAPQTARVDRRAPTAARRAAAEEHAYRRAGPTPSGNACSRSAISAAT